MYKVDGGRRRWLPGFTAQHAQHAQHTIVVPGGVTIPRIFAIRIEIYWRCSGGPDNQAADLLAPHFRTLIRTAAAFQEFQNNSSCTEYHVSSQTLNKLSLHLAETMSVDHRAGSK